MNNRPGLYIHVPFCRTKCPYCDFYSVTSTDLKDDWISALLKEMKACRGVYPEFDSLYFGGGTPSLLGERDLAVILEGLFRNFRFAPDTEITMEANPDDISLQYLRAVRGLGVTRISLGVQSLSEEELRFLRRRHTAGQAETAVQRIRECGFRNLGLDLMYGIPGTKESNWARTLTKALESAPEHLSCYQLTLSDRTPMGRWIKQGIIKTLSEEEERSLFLLTARLAAEGGYIHYEVSNYAREEGFTSRHNLKYWRRAPYLGLGPSAHSFLGSVRSWNVSSIAVYCEKLSRGEMPVAGSEILTGEQQDLEALFLGLRTREGVAVSWLSRCYRNAANLISRLQAEGLVEIQKDRVVPTPEGFVVADSIPLLFD